jgi:regulatory protein
MPVITSVKFGKSTDRVDIYIDGKLGFSTSLETYVSLGLKTGQHLDDDELKELVDKGKFESVYAKILKFASLRPRSEKEFRDWLAKHKVSNEFHQDIFNRLKRLGFLDDRKFASWWISQRLEFRHKSKKEMIFELRAKGIDEKVIKEVVDEFVDQKTQIESAKKIVDKIYPKLKNMDGFEKRKRIFSHLARKGFGYDVIREVVGELSED